MTQDTPKKGDVYVRKNWRYNVLWKVQVVDTRDDLIAFETIEYGGSSDALDNTQTITLISDFLKKYRPYDPEEDE